MNGLRPEKWRRLQKNWMPVYLKVEYRIVWSHDSTLLAIVIYLIFVICSWLTSVIRLGYPKSLCHTSTFFSHRLSVTTINSKLWRRSSNDFLKHKLHIVSYPLSIQLAAEPVATIKTHLSHSSPLRLIFNLYISPITNHEVLYSSPIDICIGFHSM